MLTGAAVVKVPEIYLFFPLISGNYCIFFCNVCRLSAGFQSDQFDPTLECRTLDLRFKCQLVSTPDRSHCRTNPSLFTLLYRRGDKLCRCRDL